MIRNAILGIAAALLLGANPAAAVSFGFGCISNTNPTNCAIGQSNLSVNVTAAGSQVLFSFSNSGPQAASITDVYFDDGSLLAIASIVNGVGVSFAQLATPANLPAANNATPPFVTTAGFSADSNAPVSINGVNPGESLGIQFSLQGSQTITNTLAALASGALRIGIHVQAMGTDGNSESFVNTVPEPMSVGLVGLGLGALALARWRRS